MWENELVLKWWKHYTFRINNILKANGNGKKKIESDNKNSQSTPSQSLNKNNNALK